ncbi:hypothetical protein DPM13_14855 [Paracoccus mutanolyticus]|uniref:Uncharacterized protein n=1 Tax=Paracoccus mutanolyticus TaxID=1499308 RepID=A0ABN5M7H7_9RHOB|nr:hypothetical protein DPM13_14855 [Paracoccus mutanolyticus]
MLPGRSPSCCSVRSRTVRCSRNIRCARGYVLVRGRLWRATNPSLPEPERQRLTEALMEARRAVMAARAGGKPR